MKRAEGKLCGGLRKLIVLTRFLGPRGPFWYNRSTKYDIPNTRRHSKVSRQWVTMMMKMSEPMAAHPRLLIKSPTVNGIVNQKIRHIPDNQAACRSASNLEVPKEREKEKDGRKAEDAYPNRRSNEVTRTRVVHPMELPKNWYLMVDETMH